ncbi:MAG TPA: N-acetylmuramoyl-L-alanine amidase [Candidatus Aquicultor sp.]|jgi:N-acetylmuramoyl-L-alanine amidase
MARRGLLVVTLTLIISLVLTLPAYASFSDVKDSKLTAIINDLSSKSIISGFGDGTFRPTKPVTRAQMAKLVALAKEYPLASAVANSCTFKDVTSKHWAVSYIKASAAEGIVKGYTDGTFRPNAQISRGELARMLRRAGETQAITPASATYKDVSAKYWAYSDIETVVHYGIMGGYRGGTFKPAQPATRAEVARAIYNLLNAKIAPTEPTQPTTPADPTTQPITPPTQSDQGSTEPTTPITAANDGKIIIAIDPGHGGYDSGAVAASTGLKEKEINLAVALRVRDLLVAKGYQVVLTRSTDTYIGLSERAACANNALADLFISIHHNSNATETAMGTAVYSFPGSQQGAVLAKMIQQELVKEFGWAGVAGKDDGQLTANFAVLRQTVMTASLCESAYMSNPSEAALLMTNEFRQKEAQGISDGIAKYVDTYLNK